jgi:hypothetical protein
MTENQRIWSRSRDQLVNAVTSLGFGAELADLMARQLGSPQAIDRMTSYVRQVRPRTEELLVDEMLAICADVEAWHGKKESERAQAYYNTLLFQGRMGGSEDSEQ